MSKQGAIAAMNTTAQLAAEARTGLVGAADRVMNARDMTVRAMQELGHTDGEAARIGVQAAQANQLIIQAVKIMTAIEQAAQQTVTRLIAI